ncbi:MAG: PhoH family protein [Lachnospiraceae bacterium]|nr:PhoH family protein [Lachnospiraceae bacterium]
MSIVETMMNLPVEHSRNIFGQFDAYAKLIEKNLGVTLIVRDDKLKILGTAEAAEQAKRVIDQLCLLSERGNAITEQNVSYALSLLPKAQEAAVTEIDKDTICHTIQGKPIKPKTLGQKQYVDLIRKKMIVFGVGPAGTGKTYLAMAMGITAFKNDEVSRIILTRPAIEAGEKLGFLPGDLQSKVDPYLRPLYDALYQIMGADSFTKNMEKGLIEVAPLAYMRGRTLDNAFIILDEAQNTTPAQMKMFLTRIGFGSKVIITGDLSQKDLPSGATSGLDVALRVLKKIDDIGICELTSQDVVRHPLVQKIVHAYDEYEQKTIKKQAVKKEYRDDVKRNFEPVKKSAEAQKASGETVKKPVEVTRKTVSTEKKSGKAGNASMKKKGERLFGRK